MPKTLRVITQGSFGDAKTTYLPGCHPIAIDKDGKLTPAKPVRGIQIPVAKEAEIEVVDERHEQFIRGMHQLKVLGEVPAEEPKPNGADPSEVQAEAPKEAPKADKKPKDKPKG